MRQTTPQRRGFGFTSRITLHGPEVCSESARNSTSWTFMFLSVKKQNMKKLEYCVYILFSLKDKQFYTGYTTDLKQRLTDHFHGHSTNTSFRRPFILLFCEYFLSKKDAMRREEYFKTSSGKRTLKIMLRDSLTEL